MSSVHRATVRSLVVMLLTLVALASVLVPTWSAVMPRAGSSSHVNTPYTVESASADSYQLFVPYINNVRSGGPTGFYGVQMYGLSETAGLYRVPELRARWIRYPILWDSIEPSNTTPDDYNWAATDAKLQNAASGGYSFLITISNIPAWTGAPRGGPITSAATLAEFTQFVTAVVQRYSQAPYNIKHWELFNEPDNGDPVKYGWLGGSWGQEPGAYANMLKAIYPAVKAVDPQSKVVFGGVAHDWFTFEGGPFVETFIEDVLKAGGGAYFDVMNFHYYPAFNYRWTNLLGKTNALRNLLAKYVPTEKPIICAEAGWWSNANVTNGDPSTPELQSRQLVDFYLQGLEARLEALMWYSLVDDSGDDDGRMWGLLDKSLNRKPSFWAYQTLVRELGVATFLRQLTPAEIGTSGVAGKVLRLEDGSTKTVYWSTSATPQTIWLQANEVRLVEMLGAARTIQGTGAVSFQVTQNPVYVQVIR